MKEKAILAFFFLKIRYIMKLIMKDIVFVIGISSAGKSTFIKEKFPDYKVLDVFSYQKKRQPTFCNTLASYYELAADLCLLLERENRIVIEHTLSKKKRREMYIKIIEELTHEKPRAIYLKPSLETYKRNLKARGIKNDDVDYDYLHFYLDQFEEPTVDEGFSSVEVIEV